MYGNKNVLITGGLGFLGSNLAHKLLKLGANITLLDNLNPLYGGNKFNISDISDSIKIVIGDMRDENLLKPLIKTTDIIFHFGSQVRYIDSLSMPYEDLDLNARATLNLLELCRENNSNAKIIFSSSRMVLGKIGGIIYNEMSPTNPLSLYGIHKLTSEKYLLMYYKDFNIRCTIFRITNPYGPRQQIKHNKYSLVGWFIRQAMENRTINIFGDGEQIRDYIYIDDMIESMCIASIKEESNGEIINLGSGVGSKFKDMVESVIRIVGTGSLEYIPWPKDYENIETGHSIADINKLKGITGYSPKYNLEKGIEKTYLYYKKSYERYVK